MNKYNNACTEVLAILKYLNTEDYGKIPNDLLHTLEKNQNKEHEFYFDWNIDYKNQSLMKETKAILFIIFRNYLATEEQKNIILKMQTKEKKLKEKHNKQLIYKLDLFEKKHNSINTIKETRLIIPHKDNIFKRIVLKIKQILKIKI